MAKDDLYRQLAAPWPDPFKDDKWAAQMQRKYERVLAQQQSALLGHLWPAASSSAAAAPKPEPIPGKTLLVVGEYMVKHDKPAFYLCRGTTKVLTWHSCPSRALIASAVRWDRQMQPHVNAKDDFGYLLGVRYFKLSEDFHLVSPHQKTVWESNVLTATAWNDDEAVRGKAGIHAAWPTKSGRVTPRIDFEIKDVEQITLIAKVRGLGRFVTGETGWRAEKVIIDTMYLPSSLLGRWRVVKRLEKLYTEINFEEETWTLERSSRLAK